MKRTWVASGSVVMAIVAVLALGTTVLVAQRALTEASDVVIRGEGDVLLGAVIGDLSDEGRPPVPEDLETLLGAHQAEGLRWVAVVDREGRVIAEAGRSTMPPSPPRLGHATRDGERVQVAGVLVPPRRRGGPRPEHGPPGLPIVVVELEPPVLAMLRRDLGWISVVAALSGAVLVAFALAWSRSARRLGEVEAKAARDERLVALGTMSSVMAHELRNPLASLKGHAQLLVEDLEEDAKLHAKAERVVREAERIESLTTSLLDFVRDGPSERSVVAPAELVELAMAYLPKERIVVDLAQAEPLEVDAPRLARAVHNLLDNALQAAPGAVELTLRGRTITVRDHGPGLPPGVAIFEPFLTTRVKGTGLGLAVARRIAEQHGGTLVGEDHPAGGALFTLALP